MATTLVVDDTTFSTTGTSSATRRVTRQSVSTTTATVVAATAATSNTKTATTITAAIGTSSTNTTNGTTTTSTTTTTTNNNNSNDKSMPMMTMNDWSHGTGILPGRDTIGPILLMMITPIFSILYYHICSQYNGNVIHFYTSVITQKYRNEHISLQQQLYELWPSPYDSETLQMIFFFIIYQCVLMKCVPGPTFTATMTPHGHRPTYTANGLACYIITIVSFLLLHQYHPHFHASIIYDKFGHILSTMNVIAFVFCILLLIKGYLFPSFTNGDSGTTGSIIQDFYWGTELYPNLLSFDVKQMTNCRIGMMFWSIAIIAFGYKNMELQQQLQQQQQQDNNEYYHIQYGMAVSIILQLIYITKFFHWEMGYMCSMDIQHDRAGFYICWGCLVWVPAVYTSAAFYLTTNCPNDLSLFTSILIGCCGIICIWINYDSDRQRYIFRQTNGLCRFWNANESPNHIVAKYTTTDGEIKSSLLLVDGYWVYSRHFHYVPEIIASFFWSCPALYSSTLPYFYVIYLTILLTDRAYRDDHRCRMKYTIYWDEYCNKVPYKIVPGII